MGQEDREWYREKWRKKAEAERGSTSAAWNGEAAKTTPSENTGPRLTVFHGLVWAVAMLIGLTLLAWLG